MIFKDTIIKIVTSACTYLVSTSDLGVPLSWVSPVHAQAEQEYYRTDCQLGQICCTGASLRADPGSLASTPQQVLHVSVHALLSALMSETHAALLPLPALHHAHLATLCNGSTCCSATSQRKVSVSLICRCTVWSLPLPSHGHRV